MKRVGGGTDVVRNQNAYETHHKWERLQHGEGRRAAPTPVTSGTLHWGDKSL